MMVKFEVSIEIDCLPDIVDQALMSAENATYWTTMLDRSGIGYEIFNEVVDMPDYGHQY